MAAQRAGQIGVLSEMGKVSNKTEMKQSFPGTLAQNVAKSRTQSKTTSRQGNEPGASRLPQHRRSSNPARTASAFSAPGRCLLSREPSVFTLYNRRRLDRPFLIEPRIKWV